MTIYNRILLIAFLSWVGSVLIKAVINLIINTNIIFDYYLSEGSFDNARLWMERWENEMKEYEAGRFGNAIFEWKFGLNSHWGQHVVDALRALHAVRTQ